MYGRAKLPLLKAKIIIKNDIFLPTVNRNCGRTRMRPKYVSRPQKISININGFIKTYF